MQMQMQNGTRYRSFLRQENHPKYHAHQPVQAQEAIHNTIPEEGGGGGGRKRMRRRRRRER
jgi:hypothetical protein